MGMTYDCDMKSFGVLDSSEITIAIPGDRWWPQATEQEGENVSRTFPMSYYGANVTSAQMLEVSPLGVGTALRLERGAWSMVK